MEELELTGVEDEGTFTSLLAGLRNDGNAIDDSDGFEVLSAIDGLSGAEPQISPGVDRDDADSSLGFEIIPQSIVLSDSEFQAALNTAVCTSRSFSGGLLQPWERGPMRFLFGDPLTLRTPMALQSAPPKATETPDRDVGSPSAGDGSNKRAKTLVSLDSTFAHCISGKPDCGFLEKKEADKKLAVGKLVALVMMSPGSFTIGRTILEEEDSKNLEGAMYETIDMVLAMKSPNTLNKRAGALLLYSKWFKANRTGEPFPIQERDVAAYLFSLRRSGEFISRGASFRESLRFAHFTLGLDGAISACDSPRVKGGIRHDALWW